jgi:hypothetical protein
MASGVYRPDGSYLWHDGSTGLFVSQDHASTSAPFAAPEPIYYSTLAQQDDKTFLLNNNNGNLWRHTQGQWAQVATTSGGYVFAFADRVVLATSTVLRTSADNGDTWVDALGAGLPLDNGGEPIFPMKLIEAGGSWFGLVDNTVYRTQDAGDTWVALPALPFVGAATIVYGDGHLYCGTSGAGVWRLAVPVGVPEEAGRVAPIKAWPVPATDVVTFELPPGVAASAVELVDVGGRVVLQRGLSGDRPQLALDAVAAGLYQATLRDAAGHPLGTARVVVLR